MANTKSIIWSISTDRLQEVVDKSSSYSEILQHFGFRPDNIRTLRRRLSVGDIRCDHIKNYHKKTLKLGQFKRRPLTDLLVEHSKCSRTHLRRRLIKENLLKNECYICGLTEWYGKKLSLELDHINGVPDDNRLENLRILCPNCHSCTETHSGKNKERRRKSFNCRECGKEKTTSAERCNECNGKVRRKVDRPSKEELQSLLDSGMSMVKIGNKYGVSDNAVRKWLKHYV